MMTRPHDLPTAQRWIVLPAVWFAVLASAKCLPQHARAQAPQAAPPAGVESESAEAPPHGHAHPHYEPHKHPTTDERARFTTNRVSQVVLPLPEEQDAFVFAVFGDRTGGPPEGVEILKQAVRDVNLFEPDLVMTVGDLIQGYNDTASWLPEMRQFKQAMRPLLCPWFPVAGNHDIYWRGPGKPPGEHEQNYEMHFGPLWYAFQHKNSWFIVLFSDEGDPSDGLKAINDPRAQRMSPEQFAWLKDTLRQAKDADHVFLFLHHPRWLGGNYGDDWDKVHAELAAAGNVRIVFAGHIHRMRYDGPKDGIEYVTLATVGGGQSGLAQDAGYLHHYHLVTVRKQQIALACLPVGEVMDVRKITGEVSEDIGRLTGAPPTFQSRPVVAATGSSQSPLVVELFNPASRPVELEIHVDSEDKLWTAVPDHVHRLVHPGQRVTQPIDLRRLSSEITTDYQPPRMIVRADYLAEGARIALTERRIDIPVKLQVDPPAPPEAERAARLDGQSCFVVDSGALELPDGPLTLECWFQARTFGSRVGLITKTESSEYGLFVSGGNPYFTIFLNGRYIERTDQPPQLAVGRWYHLAGVFDGQEVRTYLDGKRISTVKGSGTRRTNGLPLVVGADVNGDRRGVSHFDGWVDAVRLSRVARYEGPDFQPARRHAPDADTVLLLNFDGLVGPWAYDESSSAAHATRLGNPVLETVDGN